jgi:DNA polymerase-4
LHLDADAFFASLEQRDDPTLRGKPVAVGTGVVASCSYEARRHGVATGMRLTEARRLCRELIVVPGEYRRYEQAAHRLLAICADHTPLVEMAALDDLYLDLSRQLGPPEAAEDGPVFAVASALRAAARDEVGLRVSIGAGTSKLVARVATRQAKEQRLRLPPEERRPVVVPTGQERSYLAPWSLRVIPGAGGQLAQRLERFNVRRAGEVADMPPGLLRGLFGPARGGLLHEQARGIDPRPVEPHRPPQSVGRRTSFDPPVADLDFLTAMLNYLLERACAWMRFRGLAARGVTVSIRYGDYAGDSAREGFRRPLEDERLLKDAARARLLRTYRRRLPLRFLGVELSPLAPAARQPTLFVDPGEERGRRLQEARDAVRQRFGFTSLLSGDALTLARQFGRDRENFTLRTPCLTR